MRHTHHEARAVRTLVEHPTEAAVSSDPSGDDTLGSRGFDVIDLSDHPRRPRGRRILAVAAAVTAICMGLGACRLANDSSSTITSGRRPEARLGTSPTTTDSTGPVTGPTSSDPSPDRPLDVAHATTEGMTVDAQLVRTVLGTDDASRVECHEPTIVSVTAGTDSDSRWGVDELPVPRHDQIAVARIWLEPSFVERPDEVNRPIPKALRGIVWPDMPTTIVARGAGIQRLILRSDDGATGVSNRTGDSDLVVVALRSTPVRSAPGTKEVTLARWTLAIETTNGAPIVLDLHTSLLDLPESASSASQAPVPAVGVPIDHVGEGEHVLLDARGRRLLSSAERTRMSTGCGETPANLRPTTSVPPPSDHAIADVTAAIDAVLDGSKPINERAAFTDNPVAFATWAAHPMVSSVLTTPHQFDLSSITFTDDHTAIIVGTILGTTIGGKALSTGGRWLITMQSICNPPSSYTNACSDPPRPGTYPPELLRVVPLPP